MATEPLTILHWNIKDGGWGNLDPKRPDPDHDRLEAIAEVVALVRPDIAVFNEIRDQRPYQRGWAQPDDHRYPHGPDLERLGLLAQSCNLTVTGSTPSRSGIPSGMLHRADRVARIEWSIRHAGQFTHGAAVGILDVEGFEHSLAVGVVHINAHSPTTGLAEHQSAASWLGDTALHSILIGDLNYPPMAGPDPDLRQMKSFHLASRLDEHGRPNLDPARYLARAGFYDVAAVTGACQPRPGETEQQVRDRTFTSAMARVDQMHVSPCLRDTPTDWHLVPTPGKLSDHHPHLGVFDLDQAAETDPVLAEFLARHRPGPPVLAPSCGSTRSAPRPKRRSSRPQSPTTIDNLGRDHHLGKEPAMIEPEPIPFADIDEAQVRSALEALGIPIPDDLPGSEDGNLRVTALLGHLSLQTQAALAVRLLAHGDAGVPESTLESIGEAIDQDEPRPLINAAAQTLHKAAEQLYTLARAGYPGSAAPDEASFNDAFSLGALGCVQAAAELVSASAGPWRDKPMAGAIERLRAHRARIDAAIAAVAYEYEREQQRRINRSEGDGPHPPSLSVPWTQRPAVLPEAVDAEPAEIRSLIRDLTERVVAWAKCDPAIADYTVAVVRIDDTFLAVADRGRAWDCSSGSSALRDGVAAAFTAVEGATMRHWNREKPLWIAAGGERNLLQLLPESAVRPGAYEGPAEL